MTYDKASFLAGLRTGLALPRIPKEKPKATYLTFLSEDSSEFTLSVQNSTKNWDGTLHYSTDADSWTVWDGTTALSSNGGVLHLRGSGNTKITGSFVDRKGWILTDGKRIRCRGNIETLLDHEIVAAGQHPTMAASCFGGLFYGCQSLISGPDLPTMTLSPSCYAYMYRDCQNLPYTSELPAVTMVNRCYLGMYRGCKSLANSASMKALTLADFCFDEMYAGSGITVLPELSVQFMEMSCYRAMFASCSGIKLSTTQDSTYQYPYRIPSSGHGTFNSGANPTQNMFYNTGGPFTGTPSINTTYYTDHPPVPAA